MTLVLGKHYQDKITGFSGVAVGYVQYISGCHQGLIAPQVKESGELNEAHWFDEQRLEVMRGKEDAIIRLDNGRQRGADKAPPKR